MPLRSRHAQRNGAIHRTQHVNCKQNTFSKCEIYREKLFAQEARGVIQVPELISFIQQSIGQRVSLCWGASISVPHRYLCIPPDSSEHGRSIGAVGII